MAKNKIKRSRGRSGAFAFRRKSESWIKAISIRDLDTLITIHTSYKTPSGSDNTSNAFKSKGIKAYAAMHIDSVIQNKNANDSNVEVLFCVRNIEIVGLILPALIYIGDSSYRLIETMPVIRDRFTILITIPDADEVMSNKVIEETDELPIWS